MTPEFRKEAYRMFWLVKGHLGCHTWPDEDIIKMHDSYFVRNWRSGCDGAPHYEREEGFEEAYEEIIGTENTP
tara:strand:+ start:2367 stop:2585 length:219 start_codon:yes stop_codon:yes gene_type:complete